MTHFYNRTRQSASIPKRLRQQRLWHLLPIYYLMLTSDLAREGIRNSGSYKFADHVYARRPSGRYGVGFLLDAILLSLPSAGSMRSRYLHAKNQIIRLANERRDHNLDILAAPCGLARELFETAEELRQTSQDHNITWHGLDLDEELIDLLQQKASQLAHAMNFWSADVLDRRTYQRSYDMIISLGLAEFLDDDQLIEFYKLAYSQLKPGGRFVTSGMLPHKISDYLLRNIAEIHTNYRSEADLRSLAKAAKLTKYTTILDKYKLQTILIVEKDQE